MGLGSRDHGTEKARLSPRQVRVDVAPKLFGLLILRNLAHLLSERHSPTETPGYRLELLGRHTAALREEFRSFYVPPHDLVTESVGHFGAREAAPEFAFGNVNDQGDMGAGCPHRIIFGQGLQLGSRVPGTPQNR